MEAGDNGSLNSLNAACINVRKKLFQRASDNHIELKSSRYYRFLFIIQIG